MDRIAEQVTDIEATIAKLNLDIDALLTAIKTTDDGVISPPHAAYWRRLVEQLTALVLDADERFREDGSPPDASAQI